MTSQSVLDKISQSLALAALAVMAAVAPVEADGITLQVDQIKQRYPWNGLVDIDYTVAYDNAMIPGVDDNLEVLMIDNAMSPAVTNQAKTFLQAPLPLSEGSHRITWNANADGVTNYTTAAEFVVRIAHYSEVYMVIDVSAGPGDDAIYKVDFFNGAPANGFVAPEYKSDKIVLRRIHPGSFLPGSPDDEANRPTRLSPPTADNEKLHRVAITKPFYIGIYEITQKQYLKVMGGTNPSEYKDRDGNDYRPVERVSYDMIRGKADIYTHQYDWPWTNAVADTSFMGRLRKKCKSKDEHGEYTVDVAGFDLPTEFQWEYACRAGTTNAFNTAAAFDNTDSSEQAGQLVLLGRFGDNQGDGRGGLSQYHTNVGEYMPNNWGLYDMHGNVWERCLDWYVDDPKTLTPNQYVDPEGPLSGSSRVTRGGAWYEAVGDCRAARRNKNASNHVSDKYGFRLVRNLP